MSKSKKLLWQSLAVSALLAASVAVQAETTVAGGIGMKASGEQAVTFGPLNGGQYSVTITKPAGVFFEDPGVNGVVAQKDTNPQHKGPVWIVPYSAAPALFEGATVHVCKLQGEWTCGSGDINKMLNGDAKSYASGKVQNGAVTIALKPSQDAVAHYVADKKYDRSVEGFTLVIVPADANAKHSWVAIAPETLAKAANGSPAHAWVINLRTGAVAPFASVKGGEKQFAQIVKQ